MIRTLLVAAACCTLVSATAQAEALKVGNTQTEVLTGGTGAGTVVLESGLGDKMDPWKPLLPVIGRFAHTFAYNRLGYGRSGPAMKDPNAAAVAGHLHSLLAASGLPKPWTLVGHSLGGIYVLTFARLYPNEVGSVVLVDTSVPGQTDFLRSQVPSDYKLVRMLTGLMGGNAKAEFLASEGGKPQFDALGPFPRVPIYLLRGTKPDKTVSPKLKAFIVEQQNELVALSPCPVVRDVANAGHYVHRDQPKAVLAAIYEASTRNGC